MEELDELELRVQAAIVDFFVDPTPDPSKAIEAAFREQPDYAEHLIVHLPGVALTSEIFARKALSKLDLRFLPRIVSPVSLLRVLRSLNVEGIGAYRALTALVTSKVSLDSLQQSAAPGVAVIEAIELEVSFQSSKLVEVSSALMQVPSSAICNNPSLRLTRYTSAVESLLGVSKHSPEVRAMGKSWNVAIWRHPNSGRMIVRPLSSIIADQFQRTLDCNRACWKQQGISIDSSLVPQLLLAGLLCYGLGMQ